MHISSPKYGIITLSPSVPANLERLLVPGSDPFFCERDFGTILIQQFNSGKYSFRYSVFNILKKITLFFTEENSDMRIRFVTKNRLSIERGNAEKVFLREGEFILFNGRDNQETIFFEEGKEYRLFDTAYSPKMLKGLLEAFPSLTDFITNTGGPAKLLKNKRRAFAPKEMAKIVNDLLRRPQSARLRRFYFENKVSDYLFEILAQADTSHAFPNHLTKKEEDAALTVREIILADLTKHHTVQQLSQRVGLNESDLKVAFKKMFGTGIFECLTDARMQEAMRLLIETDKPPKEIASLVGYRHLTNFGIAFSKYFKETPGYFRKK